MRAGPGVFGLPTRDPSLVDVLTVGLAEVEAALAAAVDDADDYVAAASRHLVDAGGKRFRPLLTLLAAQLGEPGEGVVPAAVVVELTHLASLYHDDVMDEAPLRRGAPSANTRFGNTVAILTGDRLFARASGIVADLGPDAVRIQARTFERLCTGQIAETVGPAPGVDPVEHHLRVLVDKTGALIATAGRFGAMFAGCDGATVEVLQRYGECIGIAFQLADDVLDLSSDSGETGKTPGTDLREGVATLPVLLARQAARPQDTRLLELLDGDLDDASLAEAVALLRRHPALDRAREEARRWADEAREALTPLADVPARAALAALADGVVTRTG